MGRACDPETDAVVEPTGAETEATACTPDEEAEGDEADASEMLSPPRPPPETASIRPRGLET